MRDNQRSGAGAGRRNRPSPNMVDHFLTEMFTPLLRTVVGAAPRERSAIPTPGHARGPGAGAHEHVT